MLPLAINLENRNTLFCFWFLNESYTLTPKKETFLHNTRTSADDALSGASQTTLAECSERISTKATIIKLINESLELYYFISLLFFSFIYF